MKKYLLISSIIIGCSLLNIQTVWADDNLAQKLAGRILLQIESHGEAWYVNPIDYKRYYLGRPDDAFKLMRDLGFGIINDDLDKIPVGLMEYADQDSDRDGLANRLEEAIGTDPENADTDNDSYNDKPEIEQGYLPTGAGRQPLDDIFAKIHAGKIFLQIKGLGQAWYINPADNHRYYLGRPADAFSIMKSFGLGITNANLEKIPISLTQLNTNSTPISTSTIPSLPDKYNPDEIFNAAATAIRTGQKEDVVKFFMPEMKKALEYTMDFLDTEGKFTLGNIMAGATLSESTDTKKTYSTEVYFSLGDYNVPVKFFVEKQTDDTWLLTNL